MIAELADAILARLRAKFPGWQIDHYPDVPERHPFLAASRAMLVTYGGSTDSDAQALAPMATDRATEFSVIIFTRSLRGPDGQQATVDAVRRALFGWRAPQGGTPLVPVRDQFLGEDQGVWRFAVVVRLVLPCVAEAQQEPALGAPIVEVDTDSTLIGDAA